MGVNTPASAVVIVGLEHPGPQPYTVAEYKNLVGRAGRLGFDERGTSYLLALDGRNAHYFWDHYVRGTPEDLQSRFLDASTDARTLIVRVLVAARKAAGEGIEAEEIIEFLESSFGAFQQIQRTGHWRWSREDLVQALADLAQHGLVEVHANGRYGLTALGRLAGESSCEVASIISLVDCLGPLDSMQISDPTLITAVQTTVELDQVLFPINKKSTQKEPQTWFRELSHQDIPGHVSNQLRRGTTEQSQETLRAKKAVAFLFYVSGRAMSEIEQVMTQFGGAFGGAAGPIRAVATRTCDLLRTAARIAELLHPGLDLTERLGRLLVRLDLGIPAAVVEIGRYAGNRLLRGDYRRLADGSLVDASSIENADDRMILACVDNNQQKLLLLRSAAKKLLAREHQLVPAPPLLEPYKS